MVSRRQDSLLHCGSVGQRAHAAVEWLRAQGTVVGLREDSSSPNGDLPEGLRREHTAWFGGGWWVGGDLVLRDVSVAMIVGGEGGG